MMLALPAPFGLGQKSVHISIRLPNDQYEIAETIALSVGCPPPVAKKVSMCIRYSGRYDCIVNVAVSIPTLRELVEGAGGTLESFDMNELDFPIRATASNSQTIEWNRQMRRNPLDLLLHGFEMELLRSELRNQLMKKRAA